MGFRDECMRLGQSRFVHKEGGHGCGWRQEEVIFLTRKKMFLVARPGVATMLRQSGNILDTARAICSRSDHVLGFVSQDRVDLLM